MFTNVGVLCISVHAQHHMVVVAHHGVGRHVNGEHRGQLADAGFYPTPAVVKVLASGSVLAAQKSAAHTAVHHVVPRRVGEGNQG